MLRRVIPLSLSGPDVALSPSSDYSSVKLQLSSLLRLREALKTRLYKESSG